MEIWLRGRAFEFPVADARGVTGVRIDPERVLPDVERANDARGDRGGRARAAGGGEQG